ncbi:MAG: hypothetical protein NC324_06730 [Bacteroides sp.]|nr:hypothetical protein [Bacteroides sp.]
MKTSRGLQTVLPLALCLLLGCMASCKKDVMRGKVAFTFGFTFDGEPLNFDTECYTISSGNVLRFDNIQYFVSDPVFVNSNGERRGFTEESDRVHYVDSDIPSTLQWNLDGKLEADVYEYVEFVYGLAESYNQSGHFSDAPESLMFWPDAMGGGYHHLKLNGWYAPDAADTAFYPFGFHAGTDTNAVCLRDTLRLFLTDGLTKTLTLNMEVANWFNRPNVWDFEEFGGSVMQNPKAQLFIKENARDVFSIR